MMKYILRKMDIKKALAFGLGHGGIEAILFVGIALVLTNPMLIDSQQLLMSGLERFSAIIFHLGFSVLVYQMIFKSKKFNLLYAISLHTLVNFVSVVLMMNGVNMWIIEGVLFFFAIIMIIFIKSQWREA